MNIRARLDESGFKSGLRERTCIPADIHSVLCADAMSIQRPLPRSVYKGTTYYFAPTTIKKTFDGGPGQVRDRR